MYYFMTGNILNLTPSTNLVNQKSPTEFAARSPDGIMRHVVNNEIVEEQPIIATDAEDMRIQSSQIARRMLAGAQRKRKKSKPVKRCRCKK